MDTFLQELQEARAFRRISHVKGESVESLAAKLFAHFLALRILMEESPTEAKRYCDEVMSYHYFKEFRTSQPDMYNLIVLIMQQYDYADVLFNNWKLKIPEMRMRRILRSWQSQKPDDADFGGFMIVLQKMLPDLPSTLITIRREIPNYSKLLPVEQKTLAQRLLIIMRDTGIQSDLWILLHETIARKNTR